jgi:hypothetical protein
MYKFKIASTINLRLLENASRISDKTRVRPLEMSIQCDLSIWVRVTINWTRLGEYIEEHREESSSTSGRCPPRRSSTASTRSGTCRSCTCCTSSA